MERRQEYRHYVEPEVESLFIESMKKAIEKVDKKKFGLVGIIGSHEQKESHSHDIDVLIFPSVTSKIGETIIEIGRLYDAVEKELKKHHERFYIAAAPKKILQESTYYLASIEEGAAGLIPVHSLFFTDKKSFNEINPVGFRGRIKKNLITLHGDFNVLDDLKVFSELTLEPYMVILDFEMTSRIKTFPRHLVRASAESLFEFLKKKYGLEGFKKHHDIEKIKKEFTKLLHNLDKKAYV